MEPFLSLRHVSKTFHANRALNDISINFMPGEVHCLAGQNGCGKSTLIKIISGVYRPDEGAAMTLGGKTWPKLTPAASVAHGIQVIYQDLSLFPNLSVWENIVLPIQLDGRKVDREYVREVISILGLEKKLKSLPNQLSGGQQQRVAIARAMATKPAILLADEPTGNLDSKTSQDVLSLMKVTGQKFAQTMVMITHNEEIAQMADRIVRIEDGRIVVRG